MTDDHPHLLPRREGPLQPVRQSHAQSRLWFLHQMSPLQAQHNIVIRMTLAGAPLDPARLEMAFNALQQRHHVLQACYRSTDSGQEQWSGLRHGVSLSVRDFSHLGMEEQHDALQQCLRDEQSMPFDLGTGPVLRASLIDLGGNKQELVITVHHIAFDGRSGEILLKDLAHFYETQHASPPPPDMLQYADFAAWEPHYITPALIAEETAFWRAYLADMPTRLNFTGRPRPAGPVRSARHHFVVPPALTERLKAASKKHRQPLFVTLATLFALCVRQLSDTQRFLIGTDVHGRDLPELADIFGFFVNQLTLKCELPDNMTVAQALVRMRDALKAAHTHRRLPFGLLVSGLAPQRQADRSPLFQVKFNYQRDRFSIDSIGGAHIVHSEVIQDLAGFELVLDLMHRRDSIEATLEYDPQLFSSEEMEHFAGLWQRLLEEFDALGGHSIGAICDRMERWNSDMLLHHQSLHIRQNRTRLASTVRRAVQA